MEDAKVEPRLALEDLEMSRTVQRQPEIRFEVALKNNRTLLFSYKSSSAPRDNDNKQTLPIEDCPLLVCRILPSIPSHQCDQIIC